MAAARERSHSILPVEPTKRPFNAILLTAIALGVAVVVLAVLWQAAERRYREEVDKVEQAKNDNPPAKLPTKDSPAKQAAPTFNPGLLQQAAASGALNLLRAQLERQPEAERAWEWRYYQQLLRSEGFLLQTHMRRITALASRPPDGKQAASGCANGMVVLWDADAPEDALPRILKGLDAPVTALAFSKDGRVLAGGGEGGALVAWNVDDLKGKPRVLTGHKGTIAALAFDPKTHVLASAAGGDVRFWELNPDLPADAKKGAKDHGPELTVLPLQPADVHDLAFSPDGDKIFLACHDHKIRSWDWLKPKELPSTMETKLWATAVTVRPDGRAIAGASLDGAVKIWESETGKEIMTLEAAPVPLKALAYSDDKKRLTGLGLDHSVLAWDVKTQKLVKKVPAQEGRLRGPWFSLDGDLFPSVACQGTELELDRRSTTTPLLSVSFGPKDQEIGCVAADGALYLWDLLRKEKHDGLKSTLPAHNNKAARTLAFSTARAEWATGGEDGFIGLWGNAKTEKSFKNIDLAPVHAVAYQPQGRLLATGSADKAVRLWDLSEHNIKNNLAGGHQGAVLSVAFNSDGNLVASGGADDAILIWHVDKTEPVQHFKDKHLGGVTAVAFAPKGRLLASAGRDRVIRLWDLETNQERSALLGHARGVTCLAFSPDGRRLASGSDDRTIKIWDVATGLEVLTLTGHQQAVSGVAFSRDGHGLVSSSWDQSLIVWTPPGMEPR